MVEYQPGIAPIKAEFIRPAWPARSESLAGGEAPAPAPPAAEPTPEALDRADEGDQDKPRKRARGQNKGRTFARTDDHMALCPHMAVGNTCKFGDTCKFTHDLCAYLEHKERDILVPPPPPHGENILSLSPTERDAHLNTLYEHALALERGDTQPAVTDDAV